MADTKVVDSPAGTYVLEVRHLINPRTTQRVIVRVSDRPDTPPLVSYQPPGPRNLPRSAW